MAPVLSEEESALDPYLILGLSESGTAATEKEIQRSYRKLSLKWHPDKNSTAEAAVKFHELSLALGILADTAKRTYVDTRLETDRRRREKYAASDKRKQEMIDALVQREEAAKKARVDAGVRRQQAAQEEEIKEAGKRMLAEAQKRRADLASAASAPAPTGAGTGTTATTSTPSTTNTKAPTITPADLTLILQFPSPSPSPPAGAEELQASLTAAYGPISHVFIRDPPPSTAAGDGTIKKGKKAKGRKAIVEFKEGNWGGCWSCWRDIEDGNSSALALQGVEGVKVKWAAGGVPDWVDWAASQRPQRSKNAPAPAPAPPSSTSAPTFGSAPNFGSSTMADLLASHNATREDTASKKRKEQEFESMTILKMRQMERERLAEQIRLEEEAGEA